MCVQLGLGLQSNALVACDSALWKRRLAHHLLAHWQPQKWHPMLLLPSLNFVFYDAAFPVWLTLALQCASNSLYKIPSARVGYYCCYHPLCLEISDTAINLQMLLVKIICSICLCRWNFGFEAFAHLADITIMPIMPKLAVPQSKKSTNWKRSFCFF
eukprot:c23070_g1_i2 orf=383-853(+)